MGKGWQPEYNARLESMDELRFGDVEYIFYA